MVICCVKGCGREQYKFCGLSFHRFPTDENLRARWLQAITCDPHRMKAKIPLVCSRHFKITDFKPNILASLKEDAVPVPFEDPEAGEIILINQDKITSVTQDEIAEITEECSDSSNPSFEVVNILEDESEDAPSTDSRIQGPPEAGRIKLINQEKIVFHEELGQERLSCKSSNHSFEVVKPLPDESEDELPTELRIQHPPVDCDGKFVQTSADIGPREEALLKKVLSLQRKVKRSKIKVNVLKKILKVRKEREKRLEQILKDMCDTG